MRESRLEQALAGVYQHSGLHSCITISRGCICDLLGHPRFGTSKLGPFQREHTVILACPKQSKRMLAGFRS